MRARPASGGPASLTDVRSPEDILACLRKHLPLVLKRPGSGSSGHLEAMLPESGLAGRFLSQVATSVGCCMVFEMPLAQERCLGLQNQHGSWEKTLEQGRWWGPQWRTVTGLGPSVHTSSLPCHLGWVIAFWVGLPRGRTQYGQKEVPHCRWDRGGNECRGAGSLPAQSHPEGQACLGVSPECSRGGRP